MSKLKVALLQMTGMGRDQQANLEKGIEFCKKASTMGAHIALFPEIWNIGYSLGNHKTPEAVEMLKKEAIDEESEFIKKFRQMAQELDMAIAITYLSKFEPLPRNTISIIDRKGRIVLTYSKIHTCDRESESMVMPGDSFKTASLDTHTGNVTVGSMICYDREFPESARILMLKGAEIILVPNACNIEQNRISQLRARAYENMCCIAMTNYAAGQENGNSIAFDGMAFDNKGTSLDMCLVHAGKDEGIYIAEFDISALRKYRENEDWGNTFRKPYAYKELLSNDVKYPFIRKESRRNPFDSF